MEYTATCSVCGATGLHRYLCLERTVESTAYEDNERVETAIAGSVMLAEFCEECGVDAWMAKFKELGINPIEFQPDPPDAPCAKCGTNIVDQRHRHAAYVLSLDVGCEIEEVFVVSPVCGACEPIGRVLS